ncbi:MAG: hypothetical protein LC808_18020 [Actinobacteria bacterium]|nr:hypothetical protein [Actinomycetota bacterium]
MSARAIPLASFVGDAVDIIHALADLAWPALALAALLLFRAELTAILRQVKRGKAGPIEFELERELSELGERTEAARKSLPPAAVDTEETAEGQDVASRVLKEAAISPRLALITLSAEIGRKAREVLASSQHPMNWRNRPFARTIHRLELSPSVRGAYDEFRIVRNEIVHGGKATDSDAVRALDYGLIILDAIERIPRAVHRVLVPRVETFADEAGEIRHDFHAVVLESRSNVAGDSVEHAFPTIRTDFIKGQAVSWEWGHRAYPEAWYRDPRDGEIKYGWTKALEFDGRPLDQV